MKKVLITGFSGFVSYYFLDYVNGIAQTDEQIEVLGIDLNPPSNYELDYHFPNINIRFLKLNLMDCPALEIAITSFAPDYILHLASLSSVGQSWKDPVNCFMNNTNIFLNLVESVRKSGVKCRILSVGSSEEYGNVSQSDIPLVEEEGLHPVSPYAVARVSQEMLSRCYVDSMGLDIILTRSFNHIGPRQRDIFVIPSFIKQVLDGVQAGDRPVKVSAGNLEIVRDFLDVRDVVRAYYSLLLKGKKGCLYNVCSGKGHTLKSILEVIAKLANVSVVPVLDSALIRPSDNMIIIGDNSKLRDEIGWKPVYSLEQTIEDMLDYSKKSLCEHENILEKNP